MRRGAPSWRSAPAHFARGPRSLRGGVSLLKNGPNQQGGKHMHELAPNAAVDGAVEDDVIAWLRAVGRPTPLRHSIFSGCFNIEYWSAELFGPPSDDDPNKKV